MHARHRPPLRVRTRGLPLRLGWLQPVGVTAQAEAGRPTPVPGTLRRRVVAIATLGGVLLLVMILLVTLALALAVFDAFRLDRLRNSEHDSTLLLVSLQSQDKGIRDY